MTNHKTHYKTLQFPYALAFQGARLVEFHAEARGARRDLVMTIDAHDYTAPAELVEQDGQPAERVTYRVVRRRFRFTGLRWARITGEFERQERLDETSPARRILEMLHWRTNESERVYLLMNSADRDDTGLFFSARGCREEPPAGQNEIVEPVSEVRRWSPCPPLTEALIPSPRVLHSRYGGDPVTIHLGGRALHRRLFVGGLEQQSPQRPNVDAVLNLSEDASRWASESPPHPADRRMQKGEGSFGMAVEEMREEAEWVIERLRAGKRVLVHCSAGFNRSTTVCCAALILLEGISAEEALARVRERHPWARPDGRHWLGLKWLARTRSAFHLEGL